MKKLEIYIAKSVLSGIFFMILLLTGLQIFILLVNQINDIGKANYGIWQAFLVILLQAPYQVYLFFPMASLLGCLLGLGILANNRELVVMRSCGMSVRQIGLAIIKSSIFLIIIVTILGEFYVPKLSSIATRVKMQSLSKDKNLQLNNSLWIKNNNDFYHIANIITPSHIEKVTQFHINDNYQLSFVRDMQKLIFKNKQWHAFNILETKFLQGSIISNHIKQQNINFLLDTNILKVSFLEPDEMDLRSLKNYIQSNASVRFAYKLAYWQRIMQPITTLVMIWLAIPFIFGPLRSSTMGYKFLVGSLIGFGFHVINKFFGSLSIVLQWPAYIVAVIPTIMFFVLGTYIMQRVR